jgi:hypothetical protein
MQAAEIDGTYSVAIRLTSRALAKARKLPASMRRAHAIEHLECALGTLKTARYEWQQQRNEPRTP